ITCAPSRAKRRAIARPMPRPPPVTRTLGTCCTPRQDSGAGARSVAATIRGMSWNLLAQQFCLELGFGVLLALAFVPRAPVGAFFYRLMGTSAALPIGLALVARLRSGAAWSDPAVLGALVALLAYPLYSA